MVVERTIRNRVLRAECSADHAQLASRALDAFGGLPTGTALQDGTRISFGWSLLALVDEGEALRACEPDFAMWPELRWSRSIDTTLRVLAAQVGLVHSVGCEGADVRFDQSIITVRGVLETTRVFLRRTPSISDVDSGWLCGAVDDPDALSSEENLEAVPIAHLVTRRRALLDALTLPIGYIAVFSGDSLKQIFDAGGTLRFDDGRPLGTPGLRS